MDMRRIAVSAFAMFLGATCLLTNKVSALPGALPSSGYAQDRGWEAPPQEFNDIQRRGFHDGIEGARKDVENHRRPDVNNRDEYRHPNVPPALAKAYRQAFRRGYQQAMSHLAR